MSERGLVRTRAGFTLLEVMIAILLTATMAMAIYPSYILSSRSKTAEKFAMELNYALEACRRYLSVKGEFPSSWQNLIDENFLARAPLDPFLRQPPHIEVHNPSGGNPKEPSYMVITISGGTARSYPEILVSRIPFAYCMKSGVPDVDCSNTNEVKIFLSEVQAFMDREVLYVGVHKHNDQITARDCRAGTRRYAVASPISLVTQDEAAMVGYRVVLQEQVSGGVSTYTLKCDMKSTETSGFNDSEPEACWAVVVMFCV